MNNQIKELIRRGQVSQYESVKKLSNSYLHKAKHNLITMKILSEIQNSKKARDLLKIPSDYNSEEWIVVCGYYAMYAVALALLAKIGFRSKNHTATIQVLEEYFVKKNILDTEALLLLKKAIFQKTELDKLSGARHKREIAQYSVTKQTTKEIAEIIKEDSYEFVNKIDKILN